MQELLKHKRKIFGLTGPIGCGKSKVAEYLRQKGAFIIDADLISREVIKNKSIVEEIKKRFPVNIFANNLSKNKMEINRKELGKLIFKDKTYKDKLDEIMHPKIYEEFLKIYNENKSKVNLIFYSAPLLLNSKFDYQFLDGIVVVNASKKKCVNRIIKRDKLTREDAINRINAQMPIDKQIELSDFVIDNNNNWEKTILSIENFLKKINE